MSKELEMLKYMKRIDGNLSREQNQRYAELENALTPPTEEEVCKALSEYLKGKVIYKNSNFYIVGDDWKEFLIGLTKDEKGNYVIDFWVDNFPPHIVIMVGRFYEGKNG